MKKILMTKYGFSRWPEEDFSDDGNRFYCFKAGDIVRVSKLVSNGDVFISARIDGVKLPYDVYSQLPHYRTLDALNGVRLSTLSDEDLYKLYEDCIAYEQEYKNAEKNIVMPTLIEIKEQCEKIQLKAVDELNEVEKLLHENAVTILYTLSDYEISAVRRFLKGLVDRVKRFDPDKYALDLVGNYRSIDFCKPTCSELNDSYYYKELLRIINDL